MRLDISVPTVLNNNNYSNQHCTLFPKCLPAWFICSQQCYNHNSRPLRLTRLAARV